MEEQSLNLTALSENSAKETGAGAEKLYTAEIEKLKLFNARWKAYINSVVKKYPSDATRKLAFVSELITEILMRGETPDYSVMDKVEEIYKIVDDGREFKTEERPSLFGETESGFNMEDVLNPGELDLLSLCKELGATD